MPNPCDNQLEALLLRMHPELTRQQAEELLALMNQRDEEIDLSDIPETDFSRGVRGKFYRGRTICLTEELHAYFSALAMRKGVSINDIVNDALSKDIALVEAMT